MKVESMNQGKKYILSKRKGKGAGWLLLRVATGKTVKITQNMVNKTLERLQDGEHIPFRKISYTVAIETGVVEVLKQEDFINVDKVNKVYTLKN